MNSHTDAKIDVLFSKEDIANRIMDLADEIAAARMNDFVVVAILAGGFIFTSDLLRALHEKGVAPEVDFLTLASYHGGTSSSGKVDVLRDISRPVTGRSVLIVDDILESGRTLDFARNHMLNKGAAEVRSCVLLDKQVARSVPGEADFKAFSCPDVFVVGYGMDLDHRLRELPYVGCIRP